MVAHLDLQLVQVLREHVENARDGCSVEVEVEGSVENGVAHVLVQLLGRVPREQLHAQGSKEYEESNQEGETDDHDSVVEEVLLLLLARGL